MGVDNQVVVVGSCNMDLISYVPNLPRKGETLHGHKFQMGCGGKGANQCVAAARLGAKSAMVAKVGSDDFGKKFLDTFTECGINTSHVFTTADTMTGVAPISVDDNGANSIIIVSGANMLLSKEDVTAATELISKANVVVCQLEIPVETTRHALTIARQHNVTTILNPAPAQSDIDSGLYSLVDLLIPNETETEIITGHSVNSIEDAYKALPDLLAKGCGTAVITLGEKGVVFASQKCPTPIHISSPRVTAIDTTGAGDAFIGAVSFYLSNFNHLSLEEIIRRSCEIASISVLYKGTQSSYQKREHLPQHLFAH